MEFKIVIPTKGRAGRITTDRYINGCITCPSESELPEYMEHEPNVEYCAHPDHVVGMAAKRQWIYDKFGNVFMMDDDLLGFSRLTQKRGETSKVDPELAYEIIQNCGNLAALCGAKLFGFNSVLRPEHYSGHQPYKLSGIINGVAYGHIAGAEKLVYTNLLTFGHEFYISGLNAYHYRKCFLDLRFAVMRNSFGDTIGGAANYRTLETEQRDTELLKSFFGAAVELKSDQGKKGKHAFSKNLKIPF